MDFAKILAEEFNLNPKHAENIINLIDEGNTIPFIARYRKELTGSIDDQVLRDFADKLEYLRKFEARKQTIIESIKEQNKMTDELQKAIDEAQTLTELEDIYRPYRPKKKTRATIAVAKGLSPLADIIWEQNPDQKDIYIVAQEYVNPEKEVNSVEEAIKGAQDIICEKMSDDAYLRKLLRELIYENGQISSKLIKDNEEVKDKIATYEMYENYTEAVKTIPSHRILAINRGEKEGCLNVEIIVDTEEALKIFQALFVKSAPTSPLVFEAAQDAYERLIKPSLDREIRADLFDKAAEQAIKMFEVNLKPLLMQPPIKNKVTMGLDPAYRTGCKIAVVDGYGKVLDRAVVYPTPPQNKIEEAKVVLKELIRKHNVEVISIGNGTASKESEIFIAELIKEIPERKLSYMVVNEAGASVYSASKLAAEEFPDFDVAHRSAVSIARRLIDPLAELIKIDPKSIGVGQYQHDMPQNRLDSVLKGVVEDCVNSVGVNVNSASYSLLSYVSGLNTAVAKNIVKFREERGKFNSRYELRQVPKLGDKAFEQCAGFLRIPDSNDILDNTAVHPESYDAARKILNIFKVDLKDKDQTRKLPLLAKEYGEEKLAKECQIGVPTLLDIIDEMMKPGRDIRDELPPPMLRTDIMSLEDLRENMELVGTVRNVIDFGVFVDIGVHQDGLVHISEITDAYIKHPSQVVSVGETVKVKVKSVDVAKNRISLIMKGMGNKFIDDRANALAQTKSKEYVKQPREEKTYEKPVKKKINTSQQNSYSEGIQNLAMADALKQLADKFNKR